MSQERILVVDDSDIVLEMARDALEEGGFRVETAHSAKEADSFILGTLKPDLIVLDVMLPVLDGDKKAKMLKKNAETRSIPILLISSKPEHELRRLVYDSGADGYIRKPFASAQIVSKVRETIGGS